MNQPPRKKVAARGCKQIYEENMSTLKFYQYSILGSSVLYFSFWFILSWSFTPFYVVMPLFALFLKGCSYYFMSSMAKPTFDSRGSIEDAGSDLNMEGGVAESAKDIILLTSFTLTASIFSDYFWLLLLLMPSYALYKLWVSILGPWFFAPAPEVDLKKQKKMERKMAKRY